MKDWNRASLPTLLEKKIRNLSASLADFIRFFDSDRMIFLALDAQSAISYVEAQDTETEEIVLLKISLDSLNPLYIGYDWNNRCEYKRDINSVVYTKDIPPQEIHVCNPENEPEQDIDDFKQTALYEIVLSVFDEEVETNKEIF